MDMALETIQTWITLYGLKLLGAVVIFIVGRWVARRLSKLLALVLEKGKAEVELVQFLKNLSYYLLLVVVVVAALGQLGVQTASLLTIIGAAGLAVGLALKDSLSNFAAGVMLIMFRFYRVGDYIQAGGAAGTVQTINIFNTVMISPDNQKIFVPNSAILNGTITNVTANDTRRIDLVMGIGYGDDIPKAKKLLEEIVAAHEGVLKDPAPQVAVSELGDSSVNFVVRPWVKTSDYWAVRFELTQRIKMAFDENGISIPFPQRDVHLINDAEPAQ